MRLPGAGPAGWGARSGPRPHLAGDGGRRPQLGPEPLAPRSGAPVTRPLPLGHRERRALAELPGTPPRVPELRQPRQLHGPQNSLRVSVESLRQNHLGSF